MTDNKALIEEAKEHLRIVFPLMDYGGRKLPPNGALIHSLTTALEQADRALITERERAETAERMLKEAETALIAAEALVARLEYIHNDLAYQAVWILFQNHVGPYRGPKYSEEFAVAKAAIASARQRQAKGEKG